MAHYHRHHPPPGQKRQPVYYGRNGGFLSARNSLLILLLLCINNNHVHGFFTSTTTSTTTISTSRGQITKKTAKSAAAATTLLLQARRRPLLSTPPTPSTQTQLYMAYIPQKEEDDNSKNNALPTTTTTTSSSSSSSSSSKKTVEKKPLLTPKVGDIVRYYDLDGGNRKGQELVGKITFLTKVAATAAAAAGGGAAATSGTSNKNSKNKNNNNKNNNINTYVAELTQLEDLGEGYFAEFSSTKRMSKKSDRDILQVSPLRASFVRSEQAYKVPFDAATQKVKVRQEQYDIPLDGSWEGPQPQALQEVNMDVVEADGILYSQLKFKLLKNAALAGLLGTVIANIVQGTEDAAIYFAGAVASVLYLFFLSIKIDTLGSLPNQKLGTNVSNLRFLMPVLVVVGVALYNQSRGEANPLAASTNPFGRITTEQFAAAILGFLTYRIPLFLGQVQEAFQQEQGGDGVVLPGSAGVAMQLAQAAASTAASAVASNAVDESSSSSLITVLLISGPQYTGRDALVEQLLREDDRLVPPILVDKMTDGVTFERLANRNEFLQLDSETEPRYGWTKDGILKAAAMAASSSRTNSDGNNDNAAPAETTTTTTTTTAQQQTSNNNKVVVVNADVALAKKLQYSLSGARLIGVWVGLDSVQEFERRIGEQIDQGLIEMVDPAASAGGEEDETRESVIRACIKEIVQEIDFGLSSGIFEFTILNQDPAKSLKELKEAASYCFK